jgi:tetratricopeptide (TPR) repeat protein
MQLDAPVSSALLRRADARIVFDDLLTVRARVVRWELCSWCAIIANMLGRAVLDAEQKLEAVAGAFHEATQVACHLGRYDDALALSHAGLRFFVDVAERRGDASAVVRAISALVDIGRVERARGRTEEALLHFGRVRSLALGVEIMAGPVSITRSQWEAAMACDPVAARWAAADAAAETLVTLLAANRDEEVLSLAQHARRATCDPPELAWTRREAALLALCRVGRVDEALALASRATVEASEADRPLFELRRAEVLAAAGEMPRAKRLVESVAAMLERKWQMTPAALDDVRVAASATKLCVALGDPIAADFCWSALAEALAIGDVPLEADLLVRIVETDWDEERRLDASDLLRAVVEGSGFLLPAAERLIETDVGPRSRRPLEERAPGFVSLTEQLFALDPAR